MPRTQLTAQDGRLSGGGKSVTYGDLVKDQELKLSIPVMEIWPMGLKITGDPPTKPVSQYTVIGKSIDNSVIAHKVAGTQTWLSRTCCTPASCGPRASARSWSRPARSIDRPFRTRSWS